MTCSGKCLQGGLVTKWQMSDLYFKAPLREKNLNRLLYTDVYYSIYSQWPQDRNNPSAGEWIMGYYSVTQGDATNEPPKHDAK